MDMDRIIKRDKKASHAFKENVVRSLIVKKNNKTESVQ